MHDKLKLLLDQLKYNEEFYIFFKDGNLKININTQTKIHTFIIQILKPLPINAYLELEKKLFKRYLTDSKYNQIINTTEISNENIKDYFINIIDIYKKDQPLLEMFKGNNIYLDNSKLIIEVANLAEKMKLNTISDKIKEKFKLYGFGNIDVEIQINNNLNDEILKEIKKELTKEVKIIEPIKVDEPKEEEKKKFIPKDYKRPPLIVEKDNPNVVMGRTIEEKPIRMDQIASEQNNVTLEGFIYSEPDIRETKTDLKIITLKLTDKTDSIYEKIFVNDEE